MVTKKQAFKNSNKHFEFIANKVFMHFKRSAIKDTYCCTPLNQANRHQLFNVMNSVKYGPFKKNLIKN